MTAPRPPDEAVQPPRYGCVPWPPYGYVPGLAPHPRSHPQGHRCAYLDGVPRDLPQVASWRRSTTWLAAVDLFNHGYYWEAHEAWEELWQATGRRGAAAEIFKALIKLAAAGVKTQEGNASGACRHARRGAALLRAAAQQLGVRRWCGVDLPEAARQAEQAASWSASLEARGDAARRLPVTLWLAD
jgi:hypothetical protein